MWHPRRTRVATDREPAQVGCGPGFGMEQRELAEREGFVPRAARAARRLKPLATPDRATRELAEREGFEPPVRFPAQRFSRPPVSTTHTPLRSYSGGVAPGPPTRSLVRLASPRERLGKSLFVREAHVAPLVRSYSGGVAPGPPTRFARADSACVALEPEPAPRNRGTPAPRNAISQSDPSPCRAAAPQESRSIHRPAGSSPESR